jgi:hypothetical protein
MVKKGYTAVPKGSRAVAWTPRRCNKHRVAIPRGVSGVVTGKSNARDYNWTRADIGGVVHTLHPWDWEFTPIRVGELRRWKDSYAKDALPFLVTRIVSLSTCECLGDGNVFGTSCKFLEDNSEVISETR